MPIVFCVSEIKSGRDSFACALQEIIHGQGFFRDGIIRKIPERSVSVSVIGRSVLVCV